MKTRYIFLLTAFAAGVAAAAPMMAQDKPVGGKLTTMPHGTYQCALPGDVGGKAFDVVKEEEFRLGSASSYTNTAGKGIYLLRGKSLTFTRGPKKGERFSRVGTNQLKRGKLICTRLGGQS
ncbi:elongation factor P [Erythrobacter crassostreae]|uniref:Elongation factor P n=1 Tax=Erythrobacter crassostreae TaxID=2828328 RepID=A0A9X1F5E2_9SPHN|nr:elongation factor P [Erythrobacter crassostrea]MBV7259828.1 elongation factor P [Erythrobacter crassostrea]